VVGQTLRDIEIICVNDDSPDNAGEILREYAARDNRIKIIDFKENRGVSAARNVGIDAARGEYIGFVDSDDYVDIDFYEKLSNETHQGGVEVIKGNIQLIDDVSGKNIISKFYDINAKIRKNKAYFYHSFTTAIYKLKFIHKYNIRFPEMINNFEDPYFSIKVSINVKHLIITDDTKYYYIKYAQSKTRKDMIPFNAIDYIDVAKRSLEFINTSAINDIHYHIVYDFILTQIMGFLTNNNIDIVEAIKNRFGYGWLISCRIQTLEDLPETLRWLSAAPKKIAYSALNILLNNKVIITDIPACYKLFTKCHAQVMLERSARLRKNLLSSENKLYIYA
jgi:glycosyltransferase involved in cell wall biosynthesis